ncbi:uncharacterized protein LOC114841687 [Diachasma alloeum]|uniref:uncharacterized protein LOC114841687 n=1 Tax=Diachasma alloeum TaxID=454923 RepID=UPI0010FB950D|nr:uncharacterized protein LOC114841687 [Diachasma alloeum]
MNYSQGKGRLYPAYSLSGSEGEDNSVGTRGGRVGYSQNNHQTSQSQQHNHYNTSQHKQRAGSFQQQPQQQHPLYHVANSGAGLSDTPTSGNASDETLTDCELTHLAREWNVEKGIEKEKEAHEIHWNSINDKHSALILALLAPQPSIRNEAKSCLCITRT